MKNKLLWTEGGKRTKEYTESLRTQTLLWIQGVSTHNRLTGECCQDFSCCHPGMLRPKLERGKIGFADLLKFGEVQ